MMQTLPFCVALGLTACVKPGVGWGGGGGGLFTVIK